MIIRESVASLPQSTGNGRYKIRIIASDVQGSSGYYPHDMLSENVAIAFPKGTKIYADHPTDDEALARPERSIERIAGKFTSDPWMETDGAYAEVQFGGKYKQIVEDFHDIIGMSIYASGDKESMTVEGVERDVVTRINPSPLNSVDLVTVAGAKGAVVEALAESFSAAAAEVKPSAIPAREKEMMDEKILEAIDRLTESFTTFVDAQNAEKSRVTEDKSVDERVAEAVKVRSDALAKIDDAQDKLLPSQVESLRKRATAGEDISDALAESIEFVAEARKVLSESAENAGGRTVTTSLSEGFVVGGWR